MKNCYTTKAYAEIYDSLTEDEIRSGKLEHEARTICNESGTMQVNLTNDEIDDYHAVYDAWNEKIDSDVIRNEAMFDLILFLRGNDLLEGIKPPSLEESRRQDIIELACEQRSAGDLEIDDDAKVSEGDDNGAYVQAWVWVSFDGTTLDKNPVQENK